MDSSRCGGRKKKVSCRKLKSLLTTTRTSHNAISGIALSLQFDISVTSTDMGRVQRRALHIVVSFMASTYHISLICHDNLERACCKFSTISAPFNQFPSQFWQSLNQACPINSSVSFVTCTTGRDAICAPSRPFLPVFNPCPRTFLIKQ